MSKVSEEICRGKGKCGNQPWWLGTREPFYNHGLLKTNFAADDICDTRYIIPNPRSVSGQIHYYRSDSAEEKW